MKPFVRSAYNYSMAEATRETATKVTGEIITDQSARADADINVLVRRFGITALVQNVPLPPTEQDFSSEVFDFQSSMNLIRAAEESFAALSSQTRERFNNDPHKYVAFCSEVDANGNLANIEDMRKMGLALPAKPAIVEPEPMKVQVVNPPEPKAPK